MGILDLDRSWIIVGGRGQFVSITDVKEALHLQRCRQFPTAINLHIRWDKCDPQVGCCCERCAAAASCILVDTNDQIHLLIHRKVELCF